jgi:hypothetical protein
MGMRAGLLPGTLDLLILKAVSLGPLHGYAVLLRIEQITGGALLVEQGALYPALFRPSTEASSKVPGARLTTTGVRASTH